jgi:hypothetical protein
MSGTSKRHASNLCVRVVMFSLVASSGDDIVLAMSAAIKPILLVCVWMSSAMVIDFVTSDRRAIYGS